MTEATMPVTVEQGLAGELADIADDFAASGDLWKERRIRRAITALNTRATPPSPAGLAGEWTVKQHREQTYQNGATHNASWSELLRDGKHVAHFPDDDEAQSILTALTANGSQPDSVVDVLREALADIENMATYRIQDGIEMGAPVWRIALEDIARDAREALDAKDQSNG